MSIEAYVGSAPSSTYAVAGPTNVESCLDAEFVGGIPAAVFRPGIRDDSVVTASGHTVSCVVDRDYIRVSAEAPSEASFLAFVDEAPDARSELMMGLAICTRQADGARHPDFRAGLLFDAAVAFFGKHNKRPLRHVRGRWGQSSDNWVQYEAALAYMGADMPTDAHKLAAANKTWTGCQANRHGFYARQVAPLMVGVGCLAIFSLGVPAGEGLWHPHLEE